MEPRRNAGGGCWTLDVRSIRTSSLSASKLLHGTRSGSQLSVSVDVDEKGGSLQASEKLRVMVTGPRQEARPTVVCKACVAAAGQVGNGAGHLWEPIRRLALNVSGSP
jgi:hypothetical protein